MTKKDQITSLIKSVAINYINSTDIDHKVAARAIGTMLYDIPTTFSGYVSESLLDEYGYRPPISKCCKEHFHSRQESAAKIIEMIQNDEDITDFIDECTTIHYTTSEENIRLSKIQNNPITKDLDWKDQYEICDIILVKDPGTIPKKLKNILNKS